MGKRSVEDKHRELIRDAPGQRCRIFAGKHYRYLPDGRTARVLGLHLRRDGSWNGRVKVTFIGEPGWRSVAPSSLETLDAQDGGGRAA